LISTIQAPLWGPTLLQEKFVFGNFVFNSRREEGTSLDYSAVFFFYLEPYFILYWNILLQHFFGISSFCAIES
jgi:hypothetical protein